MKPRYLQFDMVGNFCNADSRLERLCTIQAWQCFAVSAYFSGLNTPKTTRDKKQRTKHPPRNLN